MTKISPNEFPLSKEKPFKITSPQTPLYNCIAWAAQIDNRWCWPGPYMFWPATIKREETLEAFISFYRLYGYELCLNGSYEEGFEKVAIFEKREKEGIPTHAARQIGPNLWTSKLGEEWDVSHTLDSMSGGIYGSPVVFMKREKLFAPVKK